MPVPVLTNSIGAAVFFDLIGTIYLRQQQIEVLERLGVDGSGARLTGTRGKPFSLLSICYHDSFDDAAAAMDDYITLKTSLQTLTRNSTNFGTFIVLDVTEARPPFAVFNVAGSPDSQCRAEVKWTLLG